MKQSMTMALMLWIGAASLSAEVVDGIVAKVQRQAVTIHDVVSRVEVLYRRHQEMRERREQAMKLIKRGVMKRGDLSDDLKDLPDEFDSVQAKERALNDAIDAIVLELRAAENGIKVGTVEIDQQIRDQRKKMGTERFEEMLQGRGMTIEQYRGDVRTQILSMRLMGTQYRERLVVSDEEIQEYYERNKKRMRIPASFKLSLIRLPRRGKGLSAERTLQRKLENYQKRIKSLDRLRELASKISVDTYTRKRQGSLPNQGLRSLLDRYGRVFAGQLMKKVKAGKRSGLVNFKAKGGGYLVWIENYSPERTLSLTEVRARIQQLLFMRNLNMQRKGLMRELRRGLKITVYEKALGL